MIWLMIENIYSLETPIVYLKSLFEFKIDNLIILINHLI